MTVSEVTVRKLTIERFSEIRESLLGEMIDFEAKSNRSMYSIVNSNNGGVFTIHLGMTFPAADVVEKESSDKATGNHHQNELRDDNSDSEIDDGNELTLDDAEEDDSRQPYQSLESSSSSSRRWLCCCQGSCDGLFRCWNRCVAEWRQTCMDAKDCVGKIRRKNLLGRLCSLQTLKKRLPCLGWIPKYRLEHLKGDVIAGLTTGLSVLPQGLAYAQIHEFPAEYGLYSGFMGSFAYAVFGTAKNVAVGPSAVLNILSAQYATGRSPVPLDPTYAIILALFTGIIQCSMGILNLGFLFSFISFPVLKAFRAAAGITIFMSHVKKWWGMPGVPKESLPQLYWTLKSIPTTKIPDLLLGSLCILMLLTFKKLKAIKWKRKFRDLPLHLKIVKKLFWILGAERNIIVVTFAGGVTYALLLRHINVTYTGMLPPGIPHFVPPNLTLAIANSTTIIPFWQIASDIGAGFFFVPLVAMFECISIGKALGRKGNYKLDYNQELIAIGVGNILCSFVSGHPITGAFLRSAINFNAGVKTPAGGILAGAIVLVALTVATPILTFTPISAVAATIMMGAVDVISFHKVGIMWTTKKTDLIPWLVTFVISLTLGIEYGVFVGCVISILMLLNTTMKPKLKFTTDEDGITTATLQPMTGLMYPAVDHISAKLEKNLRTMEGNCKILKLDLKEIVDTDTSVIQAIKILEEDCKKREIKLELHNPQPIVYLYLKRTYLKEFCVPDCCSVQIPNGHGTAVPQGNDGENETYIRL